MTQLHASPPETLSRATRRIASFTERFGQAHLDLAYHAALPLALTPDLLYRLWANFQQDIHSELLNIPWIAVADLLLSNLCDEVGHELYEMDADVRIELLRQLKDDSRFSQQRLQELSDFLLTYVQQQLNSPDLDTRDLAHAQKWVALTYSQPDKAVYELALTLSQLSLHDQTEWLRLTTLIENFAEPLAEHKSLLLYTQGMKLHAQKQVEAAQKQLSSVLDENNQIQIAGINLPGPALPKTSTPNRVFTRRNAWVAGISAIALFGVALTILLTTQARLVKPPAPSSNPAAILPEQNPLYQTALVTSISQLVDVLVTDWFFQPLQSLVERYGIIYPYSDSTFRGNQTLTRAELVDFLANSLKRMYELREVSFKPSSLCPYTQPPLSSFRRANDVSPSDSYYAAYEIMGWSTGNNFADANGNFNANQAATRADVAVFLNQFLDAINTSLSLSPSAAAQGSPTSSNPNFQLVFYHLTDSLLAQITAVSQFSDVNPTDSYYQDLQSLVERYGVAAGYPDGTFRANQTITRAEFAALLNTALDRVVELMIAAGSDCESRFNEEIAPLQRLQQEFAAELATVRGRVDALEGRMTEAESNTAANSSEINSIETELNDVNNRLSSLQTALESVTTSVINLVNQPPPDNLVADMQTLQRLNEEFAAEFSTLRGRKDALISRLDALPRRSRVDALPGRSRGGTGR
jgi:hypothetical protein